MSVAFMDLIPQSSKLSTMESSFKRQRTVESQEMLHHKRARNDLRLKSRFESIFEKFGKDFTGVGDEIDIQTGKVVVNNGHLITMQNEQDTDGLANEEDELCAEIKVTRSSDSPVEEEGEDEPGAFGTSIQSKSASLEGAPDEAVSCIGAGIAAAIKMDDGTPYNGDVHGELLIDTSILRQLSNLGPHIRKSIANVQRSATSAKVISIETEDLTIDPKWRVPVLLQKEPGPNVTETPEIIEVGQTDSPLRSPSPLNRSLWALETQFPIRKLPMVADKSPALSEELRNVRWTPDEDLRLHRLKNSGKRRYKDLAPHFPGRSCRQIENRSRYLRIRKPQARSPSSICVRIVNAKFQDMKNPHVPSRKKIKSLRPDSKQASTVPMDVNFGLSTSSKNTLLFSSNGKRNSKTKHKPKLAQARTKIMRIGEYFLIMLRPTASKSACR